MRSSLCSCQFGNKQKISKIDSQMFEHGLVAKVRDNNIYAQFENDLNFLNCVVIMDETWIHYYDPDT